MVASIGTASAYIENIFPVKNVTKFNDYLMKGVTNRLIAT